MNDQSAKKDVDKILLLSAYRSPSGSIKNFLERFARLLDYCLEWGKILVVGDININLLDGRDRNVVAYRNILASHGLVTKIEEPTRVTDTTASCLDHVLTNLAESECRAAVLISELSDHYAQTVELLGTGVEINGDLNKSVKWGRKFSAAGVVEFQQRLAREGWGSVRAASSAELKTEAFQSVLIWHAEICFPLRRIRPWDPGRLKWVITGILKSTETLIWLGEIIKLPGNDSLRERYKLYKTIYKKVLVEAKAMEVRKKVERKELK